jgi:DUF4097 and DUF4098 domain-containing protein YvlB
VFFILFLISALLATVFFKFAGVKTTKDLIFEVKQEENLSDFGQSYNYEIKDVDSITVKTQTMPITVRREDRKDILVILESEKNDYDVIKTLKDKKLNIEVKGKNKVSFLELNDISIVIPELYELKELNLQSTTGFINVYNVGDLNVSNTSGDISISDGYNELIASNVSGYIQISDGKYSKIHATNVSGDIELETELFDSAVLESVSGDVVFDIDKDFSFNYYFDTVTGKLDFDIENNYKKIDKNIGIIGEYKGQNKNDYKITVKTVTGEFELNNN